MFVVSLPRWLLLLVNIHCLSTALHTDDANQDVQRRTYLHSHYAPQFRASHSPAYDYIHVPGREDCDARAIVVFSSERAPACHCLGDILLGGFFPIHQPPTNEYGSNQCMAIKRERGIQRLEAMLFALDVVNNGSAYSMSSILNRHQLRFGALIYDSCDYESYAVERAFNMLLPSIDRCASLASRNQTSVIAGVVGSASSIVSMAIADILRLAEVSERERRDYRALGTPTSRNLDDDVFTLMKFHSDRQKKKRVSI